LRYWHSHLRRKLLAVRWEVPPAAHLLVDWQAAVVGPPSAPWSGQEPAHLSPAKAGVVMLIITDGAATATSTAAAADGTVSQIAIAVEPCPSQTALRSKRILRKLTVGAAAETVVCNYLYDPICDYATSVKVLRRVLQAWAEIELSRHGVGIDSDNGSDSDNVLVPSA
jgi:hypothetical protein